ncbi:hypothetical protein ACFQT0_08560 [Hymenobacter humi]|uniref:Glycosyltransferase family 1 protein n=1 Tax=Hymenobacter humi TaxID=1411620 RepID=A0ABW2U4N5_9BACT
MPLSMPPSSTAEVPLRASATAVRPSASAAENTPEYTLPDLVCFAHLHWDFVWQRPQHLLSRFAQVGRVFYVEDAFYHADDLVEPHIEIKERDNGVKVVVAHLPQRHRLDEAASDQAQFELLSQFFSEQSITNYAFWYYTPMALAKSRHFQPVLTVYDCMDELANFKFAHPELKKREQELFRKADLVFTGGHTLYEAKREQHPDAHAFPSSIDKAHFGQARGPLAEPADQAAIPHPGLAFLAWSTSDSILSCCASFPRTTPIGSSSLSARWSRLTRPFCPALPTCITSAARTTRNYLLTSRVGR